MKTRWMGWVRGFAATALLAGCGGAPRAAFQGYAEADFVDVATAEPGQLETLAVAKGDAIAALSAEPPFRDRHPVFVGDDLTDEHGFAVVNARSGTSILVGPREPSAARHGLADTAEVLAWLEQGARA